MALRYAFNAVARRSFHTTRRVLAEDASAAGGKLKLNLVTPHASILADHDVDLVTLPGASGYFGVLRDHVPTVAQLAPGVVRVENAGKLDRYFVSGGYAMIHGDKANVVVVEAVKVEDLDSQLINAGLQKAESDLKSAASEADQMTAQISWDVHSAMKNAVENLGM
eukprot:TRINITY_DN1860_c0_g1::TRINITY_DN1860_c0_g1_i1::g.14112::m.14112 TRINITY_DN1860_c0_g1::TRINITY_DN1860_c0_g1_i1::g.14112  ORF type:complete len:182 (+),score=45.75,sp/Q40089/ATP4_IPOBA/40.74/9e-29,ATP-synt_DE_N/PF02823.11/4e-21 TRINITY_DN1860_c0_g1_i1:49-546(+)